MLERIEAQALERKAMEQMDMQARYLVITPMPERKATELDLCTIAAPTS